MDPYLHKFFRNALFCLFHYLHHILLHFMAQKARLDEAHCFSFPSRPAGSPDAVDIVLNVLGEIIVDLR